MPKNKLPCPFCSETQIKLIQWPKCATVWEVFCLNCKVTTGAKFTKKEAITAWNTRAPDSKLREALESAIETIGYCLGKISVQEKTKEIVIGQLQNTYKSLEAALAGEV